jgi:hypothetical protein
MGEKNFANYLLNKGLISRIYKELKNSAPKELNPSEEIGT